MVRVISNQFKKLDQVDLHEGIDKASILALGSCFQVLISASLNEEHFNFLFENPHNMGVFTQALSEINDAFVHRTSFERTNCFPNDTPLPLRNFQYPWSL